METGVNILVTCTKRKTREVPAELRLGSVTAGSPAQRAAIWLDRLRTYRGEPCQAEALYAGDSWSVIRTLSAFRSGPQPVKVWICSAGYGLLSLASKIHPYSATFQPGQRDSVAVYGRGATARETMRTWWRMLSEWDGPKPHGPRTIAELAERYQRSPLMVVASNVYLSAVADDVRQALAHLAAPNLLSVISAGASAAEGLSDHLLPCDVRLQRMVGGSRTALNARLARFALSSLNGSRPTFSVLHQLFADVLAEGDAPAVPRRTPLTDAEVKQFLKRALQRAPNRRATPLLRQLRDSGRACEQARFASLFHAVREQLYGR